MHFTKAFLTLALVAAPILAAPAAVEDGVSPAPLEDRAVSTLLSAPVSLRRQTAQTDC